MFRLLELLAEIRDLQEMDLTQEEIDGYIDMFFENYSDLFENIDVV